MPTLFERITQLMAQGVDPATREEEIWATYGQQVAVMVVDSTGFSRVSDAHGILHFLARLAAMRETVKPVIAAHGQITARFEADNVIAAFRSPDSAIRAAMDVHQALADSGLMLTDEEPFRLCIGIGFGQMLYSESMEGFFGKEMNLASKLGEDIAEGGEILLTEATYHNATAELVAGFEKRSTLVSGLAFDYYHSSYSLQAR